MLRLPLGQRLGWQQDGEIRAVKPTAGCLVQRVEHVPHRAGDRLEVTVGGVMAQQTVHRAQIRQPDQDHETRAAARCVQRLMEDLQKCHAAEQTGYCIGAIGLAQPLQACGLGLQHGFEAFDHGIHRQNQGLQLGHIRQRHGDESALAQGVGLLRHG